MEDCRIRTLILILLFLPLVASCATPRKSELDAEVRRLCAIDGGIKVYETVKLLAEKFNKWGQINFYRPTQGENALGPEYIYKWEKHFYKRGEIEEAAMWRDHIQIIRRSDEKLLGESISYSRRGGDIPGPWHPSSFSCPSITQPGLETSIFLKEDEK
ncbi:MAG: hypothetical protein ACREVA_04960 [Burkholderiales bacterium]